MATASDRMEVEEPPPSVGDGRARDFTTHASSSKSPIQPIQAGRPIKTSKCAFCRKDHKKCVRTSDSEKCERCKNLNYTCFGALEAAVANSPKRSLNYIKCNFCREAKQKCLPEDRAWPAICDRCRERGLPCSEPGITRKRPRVDSGPSRIVGHTAIETYRPPKSVQPSGRTSATPKKTPQPSPLTTYQLPSTFDERNVQTTTIGTTDDSNLAILSHAATIHQKDSTVPPKLPLTYVTPSKDYALTRFQLTPARERWQRAIRYIIRRLRIDNIASVFLYAPQPDGTALCNVCTNLGLSRESFVVPSKEHYSRLKRELGDFKLVEYKDRLDRLLPVTWLQPQYAKTARHSSEEIRLGNIGTIRKRGLICSFCRLIWNSAKDQVAVSDIANIDDLIVNAMWQIDGRQLFEIGSQKNSPTKAENRRIRLRWSNGLSTESPMLNDSYIVLVADEKTPWNSNFLGCPIDINKSITTTAKDWVQRCQRHHPHNSEMSEEYFRWEEAISPSFRLVDVDHMRLVIPDQDMPRYVALSYTWGRDGTDFYIDKENIEKFERLMEKKGVESVWSELPRTIQDAIYLTKELGLRYIWIDVLCTMFDNLQVDHRIMAQIFSKSFLTICAADGIGQDAGLKALHPTRSIPVQHIERCPPGLDLMVLHPAETYIRQSEWNRRGWTFQERFLSTRCLIFVANRVYWECRDANASEDIIEDSREPVWSIDMIYNPLKIMGGLQDQPRAVHAYMRCVEAYSQRRLWRPDDVLKAFEAVGKMLGTALKTDLLYGLPSSFLDLALLWEFKEAPDDARRRQSSDTRMFPTWSWAGWERPIKYRDSTLAGTLSDIPAWLSNRTWIYWYVRDRYNIPRLLHKSGQHEATAISRPQMTPKLGSPVSKFKKEERDMHERMMPALETREVAIQSYQQQPLKWPGQNRSTFFKSVPNLQFEAMDVDNEVPEDLEHRDTKYLQFWTWSGFFRLDDRPLTSSSNLGPGLWRFGILDYKDDFCGTIVLDHQWAEASFTEKGVDAVYEFVAISEAKNFTPEEFDSWTYYIPKAREESEWDLWYVLLVEKVDDVVVRRVGLGKVFQEAFDNSCLPKKEWREFIMA